MRISSSLFAVFVLCATSSAQTYQTLPVGYGAKEGARSRHVPLAYCPARIQCGYDARATGWKLKVIRELWARPDGAAYLTTGFKVDLQVQLSSKGCDPNVNAYDFDANHGSDRAVFMKRKTYSFPSFSAKTPPAAFVVQLKGDRPFIATAPTLVVDWASYSSTNLYNSNFYVDGTNLSATTSGTKGRGISYGASCNASSFRIYARNSNVGENLDVYGYDPNLGDVVFCWIGAGRSSIRVGTNCTLHTIPILFHWKVKRVRSTTFPTPFAWGRLPATMLGKKLNAQIAAFDKSFKVMRMSPGIEVTIGNYKQLYSKFLVAHRYGYGYGSRTFNPDIDDPTYGWRGTAIIFQVR